MAAQVKVITTIEITDADYVASITLRYTKTGVTKLDPPRRYSLAANATATIYDPTVEATEFMASWTGHVIWADGTVDVEYTCNEGDANEQIGTFRLVDGLPLMIGADDAYFGATQGVGGTLDVIDKIRIKEPSGAARNVWVMMWDTT